MVGPTRFIAKVRSVGLRILCYLFYVIARLFLLSYRYRFSGLTNLQKARNFRPDQAYCLASWHEHALAGVLGLTRLPHTFLISQSRDGEFVDFISSRLGYDTVRGSSSRGGSEAREALKEALHRGSSPAFTVDGPRGPRHQAKAGILKVASEGGALILPVAAISDRRWVMRSWDQNKIPKPFSKIVYQFGAPIEIPRSVQGDDLERLLALLNNQLMLTEEEAGNGFSRWSSLAKKFQ